MTVEIKTAQGLLPAEFKRLINYSLEEGHKFVETTLSDWESGRNRFNDEGEAFYLLYLGTQLIGCGGLNKDPYTKDLGIGRVRHLYIAPSFRRRGMAKQILNQVIVKAKEHFSVLRLRANSLDKGSHDFYLACGFIVSNLDEYETHRLHLEG